jgi:hypothetical protein
MLVRGIQGVAEDVFIHVMAVHKMEEDELSIDASKAVRKLYDNTYTFNQHSRGIELQGVGSFSA